MMRVVHTIIAAAMVFATVLTSAGTPVYLKAGATGDGSGSSWANACSNLTQAVAAAQASSAPIYAAGGLYIASGDARVTAFDGMKIYGGFPGVSDSETLSDRDVDLYQTIFTQDRTTNDYWINVKPDYGNYGVIETPLPGEPVIKNGRVNLPAYKGEDDAYRARAQNNSGTIGISVPASAKTVIDGLWFVAAGHNDGILYHAANCGVSTVIDCRFVGIYSGIITQDRSGGGAYTVTYHRCRYINCNGGGGDTLGDGGQAQQSYGGTRYFDSVFVGNCRKNGYMSGILYGWGGNIASWNGRFERIITVTTSESNEIDRYGRSAVYSCEQGPQGDFKNCVFKRIYTTSTCKYGTPILAAGSSALTGCAFVDNFYECKPVVGRAYCLVGNPEKYQGTIIADGCSFVGNTVSAPTAVHETGWAIGVLGGGGQSYRHVVVNCTFASNAVAVAGAPDASAIVRSQGLLSSALGTSSSTEAGVANCTFVNTAAEGVCDVAQFGAFHAKDLYVMNGVLAGGKTAPTPFSASVPGVFHVRDCTVGNFHTVPGWLDVEGLETDDVPLEAFADDATARPLFRPLARTPGLRDTYDFATNKVLSAVWSLYKYRTGPDAAWTVFVPGVTGNGTVVSPETPLPDALGAPRAFGAFTRGAVQQIADGSEGHTLLLRADPVSGGSFSTANAIHVPTGTAAPSVTAMPAAGATFDGWYDAEENLITEATVFSPGVLTADAIYTARFETPAVTLTFDLGGAGVFGNGLATTSCATRAGAVLGVPPSFVSDDAYLAEGWSPAIPAYVPSTNATYRLGSVSKAIRIIRVVPAAEACDPAAQDGLSWATAYGDVLAAYADAARYRGEVWAKTGRYAFGGLKPMSNVALIGGFRGDETTAGAADPAAHPTVFSGDVNGDTYWTYAGVKDTPAIRTNVWTGLVYNGPDTNSWTHAYWLANGNSSDDIDAFAAGVDLVTNCLFQGIVITCYKTSTFGFGDNCDVAFNRCRFLANNSSCVGTWTGMFATSGRLLLDGCEFSATPATIYFTGESQVVTNTVRNCLFTRNLDLSFSGIFNYRTAHPLFMTGTTFRHNYIASWNAYHDPVIGFNHSKAVAWIEDCTLENSLVMESTYAPIMIYSGKAFFNRCRFIGNTYSGGDTTGKSGVFNCLDYRGYFRDCLFQGNRSMTKKTAVSCLLWPARVVNCTFVNNIASAPTATSSDQQTIAAGNAAVIAHCAFRGNIAEGSTTPAADVYLAPGGSGKSASFVNNVIETSCGYANFTPLRASAGASYLITNNVVQGFSAAAVPGTGFGDTLDAAPRFKASLAVSGDRPEQLVLSGLSPARSLGVPIVQQSDGSLYLRDDAYNAAKPWRPLAANAAPAASVADEDAYLPDAFGRARGLRNSVPGPLLAPPAGAVIILR